MKTYPTFVSKRWNIIAKLREGLSRNLTGSHPTAVGTRSRIRTKSLKLLGAGEGNRALLFSLEGFRQLNTFNNRSDIGRRKRRLSVQRYFTLSEWNASATRTGDRPRCSPSPHKSQSRTPNRVPAMARSRRRSTATGSFRKPRQTRSPNTEDYIRGGHRKQ